MNEIIIRALNSNARPFIISWGLASVSLSALHLVGVSATPENALHAGLLPALAGIAAVPLPAYIAYHWATNARARICKANEDGNFLAAREEEVSACLLSFIALAIHSLLVFRLALTPIIPESTPLIDPSTTKDPALGHFVLVLVFLGTATVVDLLFFMAREGKVRTQSTALWLLLFVAVALLSAACAAVYLVAVMAIFKHGIAFDI